MSPTNQQYEQAERALESIRDTADKMLYQVRTSRDGTCDSVILTPEQITQLYDDYQAGKPQLVDLYNQLP